MKSAIVDHSRQGVTRPSCQQGATLIEVLVSILVVSFAMLGFASAQIVSISSVRNANMRSLAAINAENLATLIRSNRVFWVNLDEDFTLSIETETDPTTGTPAPDFSSTVDLTDYSLDFDSSGCDLEEGGCTPSDITISDLNRWGTAWVRSVFNGTATISNIANAGETPLFEIKLSWRQKQASGTGEADGSSGMLTNEYETLVKL